MNITESDDVVPKHPWCRKDAAALQACYERMFARVLDRERRRITGSVQRGGRIHVRAKKKSIGFGGSTPAFMKR